MSGLDENGLQAARQAIAPWCNANRYMITEAAILAYLSAVGQKDGTAAFRDFIESIGGVKPFKPCVYINDEAGITEATFEDVPYVAVPVFDGVHHWIDKHLAMDDGRLVGLAVWKTRPAQTAP